MMLFQKQTFIKSFQNDIGLQVPYTTVITFTLFSVSNRIHHIQFQWDSVSLVVINVNLYEW